MKDPSKEARGSVAGAKGKRKATAKATAGSKRARSAKKAAPQRKGTGATANPRPEPLAQLVGEVVSLIDGKDKAASGKRPAARKQEAATAKAEAKAAAPERAVTRHRARQRAMAAAQGSKLALGHATDASRQLYASYPLHSYLWYAICWLADYSRRHAPSATVLKHAAAAPVQLYRRYPLHSYIADAVWWLADFYYRHPLRRQPGPVVYRVPQPPAAGDASTASGVPKAFQPLDIETEPEAPPEPQQAAADTHAPIGDMAHSFIATGLISEEQLRAAREIQRMTGAPLGQIFAEQGFITPEELVRIRSIQLNMPIVDLTVETSLPEAIELVPEELARKHKILPLEIMGDSLVIVMADPYDTVALGEVAQRTGLKVIPTMAIPDQVEQAIVQSYGEEEAAPPQAAPSAEETLEALGDIVAPLEEAPEAVEANILQELSQAASDVPIVKAWGLILAKAVKHRASDIHITPGETSLKVRFRIDGAWHDSSTLPRAVHPAMLTRLKIMANMNIAERRRPQDGGFTTKMGDEEVDFRVATIGTNWGESAVVRVLGKSFDLFDLESVGMPQYLIKTYETALASTYGMIIISGPTGSGKTTSLYASLMRLDATKLNIMSIEDPIEYKFANVSQIQVNRAADITFAKGLRTCLRMAPDAILVGEIRDSETAQTAVTAALTGHLVLTSLHANDAVGALVRLIDLGVEPFLVSSAVIATASQRLVRRVCPQCAELREAPPEDQQAYRDVTGKERKEFTYGAGCPYCSYTGFYGRTGVFELLPVTDSLRRLITRQSSTVELKEQALKDGMVPMLHHGMTLAEQGITTPGEVARYVFTIG